jgi:hypothetical protein
MFFHLDSAGSTANSKSISINRISFSKVRKYQYRNQALLSGIGGINIAIYDLVLPILIITKDIFSLAWIIILRLLGPLIVFLIQPQVSKITTSFRLGALRIQQSIGFQILGITFLGIAIQKESLIALLIGSIFQILAGCFSTAGQIYFSSSSTESVSDAVSQLIWTTPPSLVTVFIGVIFFPLYQSIATTIWLLLVLISFLGILILKIDARKFPS